MADYDAIDEANAEDEFETIDLPDLPLPVFGLVNYNRQQSDEGIQWIKQITPRAGGDSIIASREMFDEG